MYDATIKDRVIKERRAGRKELLARRQRRLARIIAERYNRIQAGLARAVGMNATVVASMLAGRTLVGDYRARKIEEAIGLPWGWLDSNDPALPISLRPDPRPHSKATGRPSKLIAKLYPGKSEEREPKRPQRVAA